MLHVALAPDSWVAEEVIRAPGACRRFVLLDRKTGTAARGASRVSRPNWKAVAVARDVIHVSTTPSSGLLFGRCPPVELDFREHFDGDVCDFASFRDGFYARTTKGETVCNEGETDPGSPRR